MADRERESYEVPQNDETIVLCFSDDQGSKKPWSVHCWKGDESRWAVYFATEAEARVEYERWRK